MIMKRLTGTLNFWIVVNDDRIHCNRVIAAAACRAIAEAFQRGLTTYCVAISHACEELAPRRVSDDLM
jgi:hypothetical protein